MDLADRVERLEAELARQRDRALAGEIVANLFYARVLNISEQIGDRMDLDAVLGRLAEDMEEAAAKAATPGQAQSWRRVHRMAATMIAEIRDARLAYRPANENDGR
jgi:hypothetical protein